MLFFPFIFMLILRSSFSPEQTRIMMPSYPVFYELNAFDNMLRIIYPLNTPSMIVITTDLTTNAFLHYNYTIVASVWHKYATTLEKSIVFRDVRSWLHNSNQSLSIHTTDMDTQLAWDLSLK